MSWLPRSPKARRRLWVVAAVAPILALDLFREGQGIVAQGAFGPDRRFRATQVLAKHDETYMPREVAERLKDGGEWRPEGGATDR